jgi:uncharacterized protein
MRRVLPALAICAALAAGPARGVTFTVPALTGPVVDLAGVVDAASAERLSAMARAAWKEGAGPQVQVLVIRSLGGMPIEDYSVAVAESWRLGSAARDDGILVTVAVEDRQARIEVGSGLEGDLTDARSSRIVREVLVPAFRERRYGEGLLAGATEILTAIHAAPVELAPGAAGAAGSVQWAKPPEPLDPDPWWATPLLIAFAVVWVSGAAGIVYLMWTRRGRSGASSSSRSSSSSGSGGGWSGGGGGFSGGGASGRW